MCETARDTSAKQEGEVREVEFTSATLKTIEDLWGCTLLSDMSAKTQIVIAMGMRSGSISINIMTQQSSNFRISS